MMLLMIMFLLFVSFKKDFCLCLSILIVNTNGSLTGLLKKSRLNVKVADMTLFSEFRNSVARISSLGKWAQFKTGRWFYKPDLSIE